MRHLLQNIKKAGPSTCLILSEESIPGKLLLSRACFCFDSTLQKSFQQTIFTTCQKSQPFTVGEVLVDQGTKTLMTGTEIIFRTGVSVVGGGGLHAKLNIIGPCTDDLSGRYNNSEQNNGSEVIRPIIQNNNFDLKTEGEGFSITISPNPINAKEQKLNVRLAEIQYAQCQLFDLLGKEILKTTLSEGNTQIQLPEDAKGIYVLKIILNNGSQESKKLIIQ